MSTFFLHDPDLLSTRRLHHLGAVARKLINIGLAALLTFAVVGSAACAIHIVFNR